MTVQHALSNTEKEKSMQDQQSQLAVENDSIIPKKKTNKKRNSIHLKSGSYWVVLREKHPVTKSSRIVWHGPYKDRETAEYERDQRKRALKDGSALQKDQITLNEFLTIWLEAHSITKPLRPSTRATYEEKIRNYITPTLGRLPVQSIRPLDVRNWLTNLSKSGGRSGDPLAARTVRYVGSILREALNAAIDEYELIKSNPSARIKLPMPTTSKGLVWTVAEMQTFAESSGDHRLTDLYILLGATGARIGEVLALTWDDIDFAESTVYISKAVAMVKGVRTVDATKTGRSRLVAIDARTMNGLRAHKARQNTERLESAHWQDSNYVFCGPDGSGLRPDYAYKQFQRLIKLSGVRRIRLHDLRHTHATWLLEAGEHLYVVAERLGHTDPQTTSRIYAHVSPDQRSSVANVFARVRDGIQ